MIIFAFSTKIQAQSIVLMQSKYSTLHAAMNNPSASADPEWHLDGSFFSLGISANNNFFYADKSFFGLGVKNLTYTKATPKIRADIEVEAIGPSFTFGKEKFGFIFYNRIRSITSVRNVPAEVGVLGLEGIDFESLVQRRLRGENFKVKSMTWAEIAMGFSYIVKQQGDDLWSAGITVKRLSGLNTLGIRGEELAYETDSTRVQLNALSADWGFAVPGFRRGGGFGVDLGFTMKKMKHNIELHRPHSFWGNCETFDYNYKLSFALLDLGFINFNQSTVNRNFNGTQGTINDFTTIGLSGFRAVDQNVVDRIGGDGNPTITTTNQIRAWLPMALNVQFDKHLEKNYFFNTTIMAGIPNRFVYGANRPSFMAFTFRYESEKLSWAVPLSITGQNNPQLGLMLRAYWFFIGTNNMIPFVAQSKMFGGDVYFGFKFHLKQAKECRPVVDDTDWWCPGCPDEDKF